MFKFSISLQTFKGRHQALQILKGVLASYAAPAAATMPSTAVAAAPAYCQYSLYILSIIHSLILTCLG